MNSIYVSGPISVHILQNGNIKYYLFGDVHTKPKINSCQEMYGLSCTSINRTFDNIIRRNTNCWSIAALLYNWFKVNNDNKIMTDFFLEIPFIKTKERERIQPLINIVSKRHDNLNNDDDVDDQINQLWILTLELLFKDYLVPDKRLCSKYIHMHYADTRLTANTTDDINLFLVADFMESKYYDYILNFLYNDRYEIYDKIYMGNENLDKVINSFKLPNDPEFVKRFKDIIRMQVIRNGIKLHRVAAEYNRLKEIHPEIAYKLRNFVFEILDTFTEDDLDEDMFKSISALEMDIYTLSRIFIQQKLNSTEETVVFAGANHITTYYTFLTDVLNYKELYNSPHDPELDIKCVQIPTKFIQAKIE